MLYKATFDLLVLNSLLRRKMISYFAPCNRIQIPESGKFLLVKSGFLGLEIRNTTQGIRNPTTTDKKLGILYLGIRNPFWKKKEDMSTNFIDLDARETSHNKQTGTLVLLFRGQEPITCKL